MKEDLFKENYIRTYSGIYINPFYPEAEQIRIADIAHSLANQCRFGGHTQRFYSVAEHCIWCANNVSRLVKKGGNTFIDHQLVIAALLHDASEGYLVDLPSPIKCQITKYKLAEWNMMTVISKVFGFEWPTYEEIHQVDKQALQWEWDNVVLKLTIVPMDPMKAEQTFMDLFMMNYDKPVGH
jgi:hypothetical protein